jgi:hypothetical protein
MEKAAALAGVDWSEEIAEATASRADPQSTHGTPLAYPGGRVGKGWFSRRRRATAVAGLAALLLGGGIATMLAGEEPSAISPQLVSDPRSAGSPPPSKSSSKRQKERRGPRKTARTDTAPQATTVASPLSPIEAGGGATSKPAAPAGHQGVLGLQPPQAIDAPKRKPTPNPPPQPASTPAPPETQAPAEPPTGEQEPEHPSKGRGPPPGVPKGSP